jgi:hypothetical protein
MRNSRQHEHAREKAAPEVHAFEVFLDAIAPVWHYAPGPAHLLVIDPWGEAAMGFALMAPGIVGQPAPHFEFAF